jgi:eukaryotic-like serine/threonine-protein kinase
MGIVYLGRDTRLDRAVAIKALPDEFATHPDRLARFEREAKVLASLNHPNIAGIYGVEMSGGRRYLALEHVEGETLAARLGRGALPPSEAIDVCAQIALGVEAAHESGVVHRDLKPGNVMITPGDVVKVLDFGLAKGPVAESTDPSAAQDSPLSNSPTLTHSPTAFSPATVPGVILGTAGYLSPEQARGKVVDRRTDIWSFGCILYECLTGQRAFEGETVSDTVAKILIGEVDWKLLPASTPQRIRELLHRCLEKDPKKRLRDIGEARLVLEAARSGAGAPAAGVGLAAESGSAGSAAPPGFFGRLNEAFRRHGFLFGAGLVLGALLAHGMLDRPGSVTGRQPAHVSLTLPAGLEVMDLASALGGRALMLTGSTKPDKSAQPVSRIYARRLDRDSFEPIRGTEGAQGLVTSPDGRWILYAVTASNQSSQVRAFKVAVDGSSPPALMNDAGVEWTDSPAWLESGDIILCQAGGSKYARVPHDGSAPTIKDFGTPGRMYTGARGLPNDRGVLLTSFAFESGRLQVGVAVLDLRSGKTKTLIQDGANPVYSPTGHLLFAREGTLFAVPFDPDRLEAKGGPVAILDGLHQAGSHYPGQFALGRDGTLYYPPAAAIPRDRRMVMIDRAGKVAEWSGTGQTSDFWICASPDGRRCASIVTSPSSPSTDIWVSERGSPSAHKLSTRAGTAAYGGAWSPDGTRIAYSQDSGRPAEDGVFIVDANKPGPPRRVSGVPSASPSIVVTSWSPDGKTLLASDRQRVCSIPVPDANGTLAQPAFLFHDDAARSIPTFSPDGRMIAYRSEETGATETFVSLWDGKDVVGTPLQVSVAGGGTPKWARDGKRLYYENPQSKLMSVDIAATPTLHASAPAQAWDLDALRVANFQGIGHLIDLLPDGRLLAVQRGSGEGEPTQINVVLGFAEELKERMRAADR